MHEMARKRVLVVLIIAAVLLLIAAGCYIWYLNNLVFSPIVWATKTGGLELSYVPGKDQKTLRVLDEYAELPEYEWTVIYPKGWLGEFIARRAPRPEILLRTLASNLQMALS